MWFGFTAEFDKRPNLIETIYLGVRAEFPKKVSKTLLLQNVSTKFCNSKVLEKKGHKIPKLEVELELEQVLDVAKPEQVKPTAIHLVSFVAVTTFRRVTAMNSSLQVKTATTLCPPSTTTCIRTVLDLTEDTDFFINFNAVQHNTPPQPMDILQSGHLPPTPSGMPLNYTMSSLAARESSLRMGESPLAVGESSLSVRESSLGVQESSLVVEESPLVVGESSLSVQESSLSVGESSLGVQESSLGVRESSLGVHESSL